MADLRDKKTPPKNRYRRKQPAESSPNPHGESNVIEMPIRTDQKRETRGQNVARTSSTAGGDLNPSVAHEFDSGVARKKPGEQKPAEQDKLLDKDVNEKEA